MLPAPLGVLEAAWALAESGGLWKHVRVSAGRALTGLVIGGGLGLLLGAVDRLGALGKFADLFTEGLERDWLRWHPDYQNIQ